MYKKIGLHFVGVVLMRQYSLLLSYPDIHTEIDVCSQIIWFEIIGIVVDNLLFFVSYAVYMQRWPTSG